MQRVVVTEPLDAEALDWLRERFEVIDSAPERVLEDIAGAEALVVRTYTEVGGELLARADRLKVVGRAGVALDNIDIAACRARGVEVVHTPGSNTSAVAEFVFALLFDALRPRVMLEEALGLERWSALRAELLAARQIEGLTIGVWGMGRIGRRVARIARALDARVLYHDVEAVEPAERHGAEPVDRDELLERSEVVTVHVDDREANRHMVGADAFGRMRPDVIFLNMARGLVVDPVACARFFSDHPGAMALLDVHEPEPFGPEYPPLGVANIKLLPHIAAATAPAKRAMSWVVRDVARVLGGESPEHAAPDI